MNYLSFSSTALWIFTIVGTVQFFMIAFGELTYELQQAQVWTYFLTQGLVLLYSIFFAVTADTTALSATTTQSTSSYNDLIYSSIASLLAEALILLSFQLPNPEEE